MRVLVCGGRDYTNRKLVFDILSAGFYKHMHCEDRDPVTVVIQGGAYGADHLAKEWAATNDVTCIEFSADWDTYGKRAGYVRNVQMLEEGNPDMVLAFPGGKGTAMMVKIAKEAGVEVVEIEDGAR